MLSFNFRWYGFASESCGATIDYTSNCMVCGHAWGSLAFALGMQMLKHWKYNLTVLLLGGLALFAVNTIPRHSHKTLHVDPLVIDYVNGIEVKWTKGDEIGCEFILMNNRLVGSSYVDYEIDFSLSIDNGMEVTEMIGSSGGKAGQITNATISAGEYVKANIKNDLRLVGVYRIRNADDDVVYFGHVCSEWSNFEDATASLVKTSKR